MSLNIPKKNHPLWSFNHTLEVSHIIIVSLTDSNIANMKKLPGVGVGNTKHLTTLFHTLQRYKF